MAVDAQGQGDDGLSESARRAFARLQQQFIDGLPGRMTAILEARDAASRSRALHRLVGAAGSFGFGAISQAARGADALAAAPHGSAYEEAALALQRCVDEACRGVGVGAHPAAAARRVSDTKL